MQQKVDLFTDKLVKNVKKEDFGITEVTNLQALTPDVLLEMLETVLVRKRIYETSVEERVDSLEAQLTSMSMDVAKLTKKNMAYEVGMEDLLQCVDMAEVKDKVYGLQLISGMTI